MIWIYQLYSQIILQHNSNFETQKSTKPKKEWFAHAQ